MLVFAAIATRGSAHQINMRCVKAINKHLEDAHVLSTMCRVCFTRAVDEKHKNLTRFVYGSVRTHALHVVL